METDKIVVGYDGLKKIQQHCEAKGIAITRVPGCWDGTGPSLNHMMYLDRIKKQNPADLLAVLVASDQTVSRLRGKHCPISKTSLRARMMACLKPVDLVVVGDDDIWMDETDLSQLLLPEVSIDEEYIMATDQIIVDYNSLEQIRDNCHERGIKITFIPGCWDGTGPHLGHMVCVDHCKSRRQGNLLVCGVASDKTVKRLKGDNRPVSHEIKRARMMACLKSVDIVVINQETAEAGADGDELIRLLRPDIYIADKLDASLKRKMEICERLGIEFQTHCRYSPWNAPGISTTAYLDEIGLSALAE